MSRPLHHIWLLGVLSLTAICLSSCRPKGILHSWEMRDVLVDLHKTEALLQVAGKQYVDPEDRGKYYASVMEKHGITQAQFDSSLVWYTAHPQLFDKIYPRVLKQLKAEEEAFLAENASNPEISRAIKPVKSSPLTHAQLDSILQVTQHGHPSRWGELFLMQDSVNQLLPQIGVLR